MHFMAIYPLKKMSPLNSSAVLYLVKFIEKEEEEESCCGKPKINTLQVVHFIAFRLLYKTSVNVNEFKLAMLEKRALP